MTMTTLIRAIYISLAAALLILLPQGCTDDPFYKYETIPDGYGMATLNLSFTPDVDVNLGTRATDGDAIKDIENIFIAIYSIEEEGNGTLVDSRYFSYGEFDVEDIDRTGNSPVTTTETSTKRATIKNISIPYGRYHIYAAANMGNLAEDINYKDQIATEAQFRAIRFNWNTGNVPANKQMSGYFTNSENYPTYFNSDKKETNYLNSAQEVVFTPGHNTLHAWLRRAASKVTIDYDASGLDENIYIYLKNVTIRDIPVSCSLVDDNSADENNGIIKYESLSDNDKEAMTIKYSSNPKKDEEGDFTYVLSKGHPNLELCENAHANDAPSLFFYENMQGTGKNKQQDADQDGFIDYPDVNEDIKESIKDGKEYGTYIEVEAYYVSSAENNHGSGTIKYRFMLGKNVTNDYNAERNHHYKLTLKFKGNANDIDWHIEYEEEDRPGIYTPIYYVSYRYNEPDTELVADDENKYWAKCYPIRLAGEKIGETVTVRIVENNWGTGKMAFKGDGVDYPAYPKETVYTEDYDNDKVYTFSTSHSGSSAKPMLKSNVLHTGVWHGFLSLYPQDEVKSLGTTQGSVWGRYSAGEYLYWYTRGKRPYYKSINYDGTDTAPLTYNMDFPNDTTKNQEFNYGEGYRIYSTKPGIHDDREYGKYKVEVSYRGGIKETTLYIPLYTRPLVINQKKGFTGMNPYFSYQRYAKLRINATINDKNFNHYADVFQVRRIINPKGIFRAYDNTSSFRVDLSHRTGESDEINFTTFTSIGPWRASIVVGQDNWGIEGAIGEYKKGSSGSTVSVTVYPKKSNLSNTETANALLLIEYHDYKCVHYVHLRQGYAPIKILDNGPYWHTFNVSYVQNANTTNQEAVMSHGPLDPGAMFRYGNFGDAIDLINNTKNFRDKTGDEMYAYPDKGFVIGPVGKSERSNGQFKKWAAIGHSNAWPNSPLRAYDNVSVRLPKYDDFNDMRKAENAHIVDYAYGVCYGDGATEIDTKATTAFFYSRYNHHGLPSWIKTKYNLFEKYEVPDESGKHGMRGCFIYNKNNANVIFLPMGASSYGRRKSKEADGNVYTDGALHYADFGKDWTSLIPAQAPFVPTIHNLYKNYGACYWLADKTSIDGGTAVAWDFNYTTIDFAPTYAHNLHVDVNNPDACFLRLVQDGAPDADQCKAIDDRVQLFRNSGDNFWNLYTPATD